MKNVRQFFYPATIDEGLKILQDESVKAIIVAGGTSVSLMINDEAEAIVDITRMGLNYIREDGGYVKVGATTTLQDLIKSELIKSIANGAIADAAAGVWSRGLRNVVTLGGNITALRIWSDMPVVLLALDAVINTKGDEERQFSAEDFFRQHPRNSLEPGELVTEIVFPKTPEKSGCHYVKFAKTTGDYAIITASCYIELDDDDTCSLVRIALGSVSGLPQRCRKAEKILEGNKITPTLINEAGAAARNEVRTVSNLWGSAEYKSGLIEILVKRELRNCARLAGLKLNPEDENEN